MRKVLIGILGVAGLGALLFTSTNSIKAADHIDSPAAIMTAGGAGDIADVYAWMNGAADKVNLVLTVSTDTFDTGLQYVFHVTSGADFMTQGMETLVLCTFGDNQEVSCWVGNPGSTGGTEDFAAFVSGDASAEAGLANAEGNLKVFAGQRNDPFFANLDGLDRVLREVRLAAGGLTFGEFSCPDASAVSALLVQQLAEDDDGGGLGHDTPGTVTDDRAGLNVSALVLEVDKSLLNGGGDTLAVWASTRM